MSNIYFDTKNETAKMELTTFEFDQFGVGYAIGKTQQVNPKDTRAVLSPTQGEVEKIPLRQMKHVALINGAESLVGKIQQAEQSLPDNLKNTDGLLGFDKSLLDIKKAIKLDEIAQYHTKAQQLPATGVPTILKVQAEGRERVGFQFHPQSKTAMGDRSHWDHGAGIHKNQDAEVIWTNPVTSDQLYLLQRSNTMFKMKGMMVDDQGKLQFGEIHFNPNKTNGEIHFNNKPIHPSQVRSLTPLPREEADVWMPHIEKPNYGDKIVIWDNEKVRKNYSGPYFEIGEFQNNSRNGRFQGYSGDMVSGSPWTAYDKWNTLVSLEKHTMGDRFTEIKVQQQLRMEMERKRDVEVESSRPSLSR